MASNVAAMLILALLLSIVTMMARSIIVSNGVMERASTAALVRAESRAKTNFSIESITVFGTTVTIQLKNTGSTPATDFARMDFIADYVSGASTTIARLTYTEGALFADQWKKSSISPDNLEKDVWNQTETLTLYGRLSSSPDTSTSATFAVGTPDGVTRTISVVVADSINDTLQLVSGKEPDIIPVSGDIYAVSYTGAGDLGFLKTVDIASSGEIRDEELDTLEYDPVKGKTPNIIPISGDVYAIAYAGDTDVLHGAGYRIPTAVLAHGFLTVNGAKMSKSRGTFITARTYANHLNTEYLRYYFAGKLGPGIDDLDLNLEDFRQRVNSDVVGKVVNIASRCAGFVQRIADGKLATELPEPDLFARFSDASEAIADTYEKREYAKAMRKIMALADEANRYIDENKPWVLAKGDGNEKKIQAICTQGLNHFRQLCIYLKPVMPELVGDAEEFLQTGELSWDELPIPQLGSVINPFKPLARRIEAADIEKVLQASREELEPGQE